MKTFGLYVHIPFCVSKCFYCDFLSFPACGEEQMREYTGALVNEIKAIKEKNYVFDTIYIGGGTPTALPPPFLFAVIEAVRELNIAPETEFTIEMNPVTLARGAQSGQAASPSVPVNSFSNNFFQALRSCGVNRLSLGLQAWQDGLLKTIGRTHTRKDFELTFRAAREAGFANINADVMFALPGQTIEMWRETLEALVSLKPEHISAYSLTPEEGTPLWDKLEKGELTLPGDETDREMYHRAREFLTAAGYEHYEISNFALPSRESRHNTRYWTRAPYIGAGLGASSFDGRKRWRNTENFKRYAAYYNSVKIRSPRSVSNENAAIFTERNAPHEDIEVLTERDALAEEMFLGLRLLKGVPYNDFFAKEIKRLVNRGLLEETCGRIKLTGLGLDLANQVFQEFIE